MSRLNFALPAVAAGAALVGCNLLSPAPVPPVTPTPSSNTTISGASPTPTPTLAPSATPIPTKPYLYVVHGLSNDLYKVDLTTSATTSLALGKVTNQLTVAGTTGYAVCYGDNKIVKVDLAGPTKLADISFPSGTGPQTVTPFGTAGKAVVGGDDSKAAIFIDLATGAQEGSAASIAAKAALGSVAIAGNKAYMPVYTLDQNFAVSYSAIKIVDLVTKAVNTITLAADANPYAAAADPDGKIHVGTKNGVTTYDPANDTEVRSLNFGAQVTAIKFKSADKAYAMAGQNWNYDGLVVFNPKTGDIIKSFANRIKTGGSSGNFAIHGNKAYVADFGGDRVAVVDLETEATSSYKVGDGPQDLAVVEIPQP